MTLYRCPDCNNEISNNADSCPSCGRRTNYRLKTNIKIIVIFFAFVFFLSLLVPSSTETPPEISSFLNDEGQFLGSVSRIEDLPNWANGKRKRVVFASGKETIFYFKNGTVVSVWDMSDGDRVRIYNKD